MSWRGLPLHRQGLEGVAHLYHVEGTAHLRHVEGVAHLHRVEGIALHHQGVGVVPSHLAVESILRGGVSRSLNRRFRLTVIQLMC